MDNCIDIKKLFGKNLKKAREIRNLSQDKFSELIGIGASALSKIERGKSYPNPQTIEKIIQILKIKLYTLYLSEEDININEAYNDLLIRINKLKKNKELFKLVYDYVCNLSQNI